MKFRKLVMFLFVIIMVVGLIAACGGKKEEESTDKKVVVGDSANVIVDELDVSTEGFPIVKEPIKLTFFAGKSGSAPANWNELPVWQEYKKMTNIDVDFQLTPSDSLGERRNLVLSSGEYPDAFHTSRLNSADVMNYGSQGIFIALNDLIDEYAPNFKKLLDEHPEVRKGLTMPDGNIYSFPTFYDPSFKSVLIGTKLWYNKSFLDALGMKEPTTTEEYYEYLKAVKTQDPNGNNIADEIPYAGSGMGPLLAELKGAWGLGNRGNMHPNMDMDPEENKLRFIPLDVRYKELLEYMNKLYSEGLFVDNIMTISGPEVNILMDEGLVGSSETNSPHMISGVNIENFIGAPTLKGPYGDQIFSRSRSPLIDVGAFVITDKNQHPEATVRWMDYFFSEEGSKLFFMGVEGVSYNETADGVPEYTEEAKAEMGKFVSWAGGYYPGMLTDKTFKGGEASQLSIEAANKVEPQWPDEVWPSFTYTEEELIRYAPLHTDINKYVDEMSMRFIVGDIPFSDWDEYVETINRMGLDEYLELYNAALDRYSR